MHSGLYVQYAVRDWVFAFKNKFGAMAKRVTGGWIG
jgi:hypothetical protein